jgi:flagellin
MSRIGATISGFQQRLLNQLARTNQAAATSALRLSTGSRVNSPGDSPSSFLQVQLLQQRLSELAAVKSNVEVAANLGAEAQTTIDEIRTQLAAIRAELLLDEDGDLSPAERTASQAVIDDAVASIRSLVRSPILGQRFLDGSSHYTVSGVVTSQIERIDVFSLRGGATLSGTVATAATRGTVTYTGAAGAVNSGDATLTLGGRRGATAVSVVNGESLADVRDRINADSHATGITASVAGDDLVLTSVDYGAEAAIAVAVTSGTFNTSGTPAGTDAVVTINGKSIAANDVDGNRVSFHDQGIHAVIDLQPGFTGALSAMTISDEAVARFALSSRPSDTTAFALPGLQPELLGGVSGTLADLASGGALAGLGTHTSQAIRVVDEALARLAVAEGRVNAFADMAVASAARLTDGLTDELDSALDSINGVDEEAETALLAHQEALAANTISAMAILRDFQARVVNLLQLITQAAAR